MTPNSATAVCCVCDQPITGEVRRTMTLPPASTAGRVAACQSRHTPVIKVWPRLSAASASSAGPWSPYQATALPATNSGGFAALAIARASVSVVWTRESWSGRDHFFECGATDNAITQRFNFLAALNDGASRNTAKSTAVVFTDNDVLSHVDETTSQVTRIGRLQRRVSETLTSTVC